MDRTLTVNEKMDLLRHMTALEEEALTPAERAEERIWKDRLISREHDRQRQERLLHHEAALGTAFL